MLTSRELAQVMGVLNLHKAKPAYYFNTPYVAKMKFQVSVAMATKFSWQIDLNVGWPYVKFTISPLTNCDPEASHVPSQR